VDEVALEQVFLQVHQFFLLMIILPLFRAHLSLPHEV
jgi:hypothetical protein